MFDSVYEFLEKIGYPHPIHPSETHIPIGLVVGAFFLVWVGYLFGKPKLLRSALHCFTIAFIFVFPTILFGFMDWQHYFSGAWLFPIKMKMTFAPILLLLLMALMVLLFLAIHSERPDRGKRAILVLSSLSLVAVVIIGFFGGQLVYSGWTPAAPKEFQAGAKIFKARCSGCHPHGGNIIVSNLPLRNAPQLAELNTFIAFIRDPKMPNGSKGLMPPFAASRLSEAQDRDLYSYIVNVLKNPKRQ